MVFSFKGFYPNEMGIRKFLTVREAEALRCLWGKGLDGVSAEDIRTVILKEGRIVSLVSINTALRDLKAKGLCKFKTGSSSSVHLCYEPTVSECDLSSRLVGDLVSNINDAMPDELADAAKKLGII